MEVVCKAVCGLCKASAPKFSQCIYSLLSVGTLSPRPCEGVTPSTRILQTERVLFALSFIMRNTPIRSDRSIFLSYV